MSGTLAQLRLSAFRGARTRIVPGRRGFSTVPPLPPPSSGPKPFIRRAKTAAKVTGFVCASSILGVVGVVGAIFLHDAFTYSEKHIDRVPRNPLALNPELGGPKNLPVARVQFGDYEDEENRALSEKPRLVVVGGGWGAVGVLQTLNVGDYHVTVVSAETFTTFTPLLPSAAVGTVQVRSLVEPIRKLIARLRGHFVCGKAVDIVMSERLLEVETISSTGEKSHVYLPYDKLIISCGSVSSTHGVPGLENCFQLKTISDAQSIRRRVMDNFEIASLPTTTPEERKRLLSFVVCGGGPTGVEMAAEIYDFCQEDIMDYYPKIIREEVSIHVIQSREHILNTYSESISAYAEDKFNRDGVNLITSARVASVHPDHVTYTTKGPDGKPVEHDIPSNFVLWSTGIAMNPFTARVASLLPNQCHKKAIEVDAHLRVKGAPLGDVYAIGDCSTIETSLVAHMMDFVEAADKNNDGVIDYAEWEEMVQTMKKRIPMASDHLADVRKLFDTYDQDADSKLSLNELYMLLQKISSKITSLPATAAVASQQGKYLGKKFNKLADQKEVLEANGLPPATDEAVASTFLYTHLGSLAYIGNAAVLDTGNTSFMGGLAAMYAWRSIYWSMQVSSRTRSLLMIDWIVRGIWGRDLSKL